jgi:hypothetical protein
MVASKGARNPPPHSHKLNVSFLAATSSAVGTRRSCRAIRELGVANVSDGVALSAAGDDDLEVVSRMRFTPSVVAEGGYVDLCRELKSLYACFSRISGCSGVGCIKA